MYSRPLRAILGAALVVVMVLSAAAQRGAITRQQSLNEMVHEASTIVEGRILDAHIEPHPQFSNLTTLVVRMQVEKAIKGTPGKIFTFRQYIWDVRDRYDNLGYHSGGEELLLMGRESQYGLSSPVGLEQGRFKVLRDAKGNKSVVNGRNNVGLFPAGAKSSLKAKSNKKSSLSNATTGPIPEQDLVANIQAAMRSKSK